MSVRVLIVGDEERERIVLRYVLEKIKGVQIVGEVVHGLKAILYCQEKKAELVFLDISMPEKVGLETVNRLLLIKDSPLISIISAEKDTAVEAYNLGVLDYILKPLEHERIEQTIERAKYQLAHNDIIEELVNYRLKERIDLLIEGYRNFEIYADKLPIREKGKITLLPQKEIIYCESQGKKVYISTCKEGYLCNSTLNQLENKLNSFNFFRAHQAFIVNLNFIKEIVNFGEGSYVLRLLNCDKSIMLSRSRAKQLRQKLGI